MLCCWWSWWASHRWRCCCQAHTSTRISAPAFSLPLALPRCRIAILAPPRWSRLGGGVTRHPGRMGSSSSSNHQDELASHAKLAKAMRFSPGRLATGEWRKGSSCCRDVAGGSKQSACRDGGMVSSFRASHERWECFRSSRNWSKGVGSGCWGGFVDVAAIAVSWGIFNE